MSRRKDNKGRILRTGESQRKDLIYQYRYTDALGNRKCIYASDLKILREKEDELQRSLEDGLDYAGGEITVYELLQRYLSLKCGVRYNTKVGYGFVMNIVQKDPFGARKIRDIKVSDAQRWMIKLQKEGKGYSTLTSIRGVVKPAFQMAYNEEVVRRNPFDFKLTDVVVNDSRKRISMTEKQQKTWMDFIREDKSYAKYYDEFVVLLGTGILFVLFHFFPYLFDGIEMLGVVPQGEVKGLADAGGLYSFHGLLSVSYLINQPMFR